MDTPRSIEQGAALPPVFWPDRVMGVLSVGVGLVYGLVASVVAKISGMLGQANHLAVVAEQQQFSSGGSPLTHNGHIDGFFFEPLFNILGSIFVLLAALEFVSGFLIFRGGKGGFIFAGAVAILGALAVGRFGIGVGLVMGIYVALRMWGNVGPTPVWGSAKTKSNRL